ncbi:endonuclease [Flavimaricola marinus]|uniref:NADH dehydrogenase subunit E n=1 Tax=Flavimaricola marinus TaxID=1819565 RepID=A0A238LDU6_9RHOB|nr:endonuclease [Flavimaricola marinus]SMY07788.1 NADH dehydrogenase subunit E [Flavimaricola marinus]
MPDQSDKLRCTMACWAMALLAGALAVILLVLLGGMSWPGAIFTGALLAAVLGGILMMVLCTPLPTPEEAKANLDAAKPPGSASGSASSAAAGAGSAAVASAAPAAVAAPPQPEPVAEPAPEPAPKTAPEPDPEPVAAVAPVAEPVAAPAPASAPAAPATDSPGTKPTLLTEAREGGADNLKEIKGVGPKLEGMLNEMGVYHFDQVASWTAAEVAWVDDNLKGFKGRVSRDGWVDQAKILAAGGETDFSKKVGDGGVY